MISKKQQELKTQLLSFISFIHIRQLENDTEITPAIMEASQVLTNRLHEFESPTYHLTLWAWEKLTDLLPDCLEDKYLPLHKALYFKNYPQKKRHYQENKPLEKLSARELKAKVNYHPTDKYNSEEENNALTQEQKKIKQLLSTKEHILKPAQSKLIRKMSIHAGRKLNLREAQTLQNQLTKK